jgi:type II secretion system protein J
MKGFTLLEILVSVAIASIIMAALYGAYTSNVEAIQTARQGGAMFQTARIALDRVSKDMKSAFLKTGLPGKSSQTGMICEDQEIDGRPADRIDFTSLAHVRQTERGLRTDLCEIGYYLETDSDDETLVLYRRDTGIVDDDLTEGGRAFELARMVTGFNLVFRNTIGEDLDEWNTLEGTQKDTLPCLIRIELTLKDQLGQERIFMTSIHPELAGLKKE